MAARDRDRGQRLRQIRKSLGMNQREFGDRFGKTGPAVSNYELGRLPEDKILKKIYDMGFSIDWLISGEGQMRRGTGESEKMCSTILEGTKEGLVIVQDGLYKFVNKAMEQITGYPAEELIGYEAGLHAIPEEREHIKRIYDTFDHTGILPDHDIFTVLCKDGTEKNVKVCYATVHYGGKPTILALVRDMTDRHRLKSELSDVGVSLNREERKLVRILKVLLEEMVQD
ncbi:MAG: PAS domain S-box protein [Gemmatimonadota bacterium]|nr:MAG: PAS domain S-box protein [Gemmatimonadota bacterium]